ELKGKMKEKVENSREIALLSKKLATIITDVPIEFEPEKLKRDPMNKSALEEIFAEMEFRTLSKRILGTEVSLSSSTTNQIDLFSTEAQTEVQFDVEAETPQFSDIKDITTTDHAYRLIEKAEDRKNLIKLLSKCDSYCFDTETTSINALMAELVGIAFSIKKGEAYYLSFPKNRAEAMKIIEEFRPIFEDESKEVIAH